ncbi:MAG: glycoside hydrolase N-terminal domain-containing protein [Bacteroides cellulosilyticus]
MLKGGVSHARKTSTGWELMKKRRDSVPLGAFTTMGELYVETGLNEINMSNYRRILSLDSAMAWCNFTKTGYSININTSYPIQTALWCAVTADKGGKQNLVLSYCPNNEAKSHLKQMETTDSIYRRSQ